MGKKIDKQEIIYKLKIPRNWFNFVWSEKQTRPDQRMKLPFPKKVKYALKGFSASEYYWYSLDKNDSREYISEYIRLKAGQINSRLYRWMLGDKLLFGDVFSDIVRIPQNYAWIKSGHIYPLHGNNVSYETLRDFLLEKKIAILKMNKGAEGKSIYRIDAKDGAFLVNGKETAYAQIKELFEKTTDSLLCEFMQESQFASSLFPDSANTMRIVCARKKGEIDAHVVTAVQRIGNRYTAPVDNMSAGGFASEIDLKTGELGVAIAKTGPYRLKEYASHPDTGAPIAGQKIPDWRGIVRQIEELMAKVPYLNFVAWDVLLIEDGLCIIEGNGTTGCDLFQMKHGQRQSPLSDVYCSYGIMKKSELPLGGGKKTPSSSGTQQSSDNAEVSPLQRQSK